MTQCKNYIWILTPFESITDLKDTPITEFEWKKYWVLNFWNEWDFNDIVAVVRTCDVCILAIIQCEKNVTVLRIIWDTENLTIPELWNK